ncbi:FUSC family protein, partial [Xanthomonas oryzae pv. oryzae]
RLIRATLLLEAVLSDGHPLPTLEALPAFAQQADQTLSELIDCLRNGGIAAAATLRNAERQLSDALAALPDSSPTTAALAEPIDRVTDSIGTLTHLLRPALPCPTGLGRGASPA